MFMFDDGRIYDYNFEVVCGINNRRPKFMWNVNCISRYVIFLEPHIVTDDLDAFRCSDVC